MLEIKNLTKKYADNTIFKSLDLTVQDGEVLSIVGPSGIGKTTLIKILAGLETADSGEIKLNHDVLAVDGSRSDAKVGLIFQDFNLFPNYSVLDNVALAPISVMKLSKSEARQVAKQLLETLGMSDKVALYPFQLSGGQKQRVAIARALAMQPQILAYDEPTSGLDEASTRQVAEVVKTLKQQGVTQMIITHDQFFAELVSDRVFDFATEVKR
ncbi:amino acid ABC transporter ATP-binding protein [Leuconostoc citreum]|jgi:polar amino acid transport system ATP-binding protein|uniref:ABC-type polar amino acid transport system, ATPase component n=3 Tax=Bacteria TaxID=2 RepID=B1MZZ4_LEUCK|nr:ATP-binding cassette domain-containing protein [Leuconostoc citreum]ACA83096.1 ABC-type polar amino acid transport system, ATPase component [Leuconostoc citreum KM20]KAF0260945.1 amino acid ABC transporter ATP-binding protein [Leuconostoc citreum]MBE4726055.1 amino acid ABC transporter ATP-binding protein [Leuconostoc citreum]MBU7449809.1 amino acid ABC transporter ATP-binding protein [Leuconostoc citreum]MCJ2166554.1 ATP-binding cassette domain-containing protein [Leuconostoc citreum]